MAKTKSRSKTKSKSRSKSKPGDEYMWYIGIAVVLLLIGLYFCNKREQYSNSNLTQEPPESPSGRRVDLVATLGHQPRVGLAADKTPLREPQARAAGAAAAARAGLGDRWTPRPPPHGLNIFRKAGPNKCWSCGLQLGEGTLPLWVLIIFIITFILAIIRY